MTDAKAIVTSLENKIEKLVDSYQKMKRELSTIQNQNNHLNQTIDVQKQTIKELEEKNKVLKLTKSLSTTNENTQDLKLKVNELIREVDKCIALLNK